MWTFIHIWDNCLVNSIAENLYTNDIFISQKLYKCFKLYYSVAN